MIASFGASLALRSAIEFIFGERPFYYTRDIAMGIRLPFGMRASADQLLLLATALALMVGLHLPDDAHAAGAGDARHQREPGAGPGQRHRRGGGGAADLGDRRRAGGGGRGVPRPHRAVAPVHGLRPAAAAVRRRDPGRHRQRAGGDAGRAGDRAGGGAGGADHRRRVSRGGRVHDPAGDAAGAPDRPVRGARGVDRTCSPMPASSSPSPRSTPSCASG